MNISLCMIVKNEEKYIERCLKNIYKKVNEIIIVDTGSIDATKQIAFKYTSKVIDFSWCQDFSKARNFAISKANNDWVLILDGDEIVKEFDEISVRKFINNNKNNIGQIKIINLFDDKKSIDYVGRLFNKKYFTYKGRIHEQIVPKEPIKYTHIPINISIEHLGYTSEVIKEKDKIQRNISLLNKEISILGEDPYLYYQLGKTHFLNKDYDNSIHSFKKALDIIPSYSLYYFEDLVISYIYSFINKKDYKNAVSCVKYTKYLSHLADFYFAVALGFMNDGNIEKAIQLFLKCIGKREKVEGTSSYYPYYNLGVIYEMLGDFKTAIDYYKKASKYSLAQKRMEYIMKDMERKSTIEALINENRLDEAKKEILLYEESHNYDADIFSMKAIICIMENKLKEAKNILLEGVKYYPNNFDIIYNLSYILKIQKEYELSLFYYKKALELTEEDHFKEEIKNIIEQVQEEIFKNENNNHNTSIVILTYNNLEYNKVCLESIRKYTEDGTYEIIVVDNNSTDGTVEWLKQQKDIKLILNKENLGFPKGCNQGIKIAEKNNDLLLLNNDTIVTPNWLNNLKKCLHSSEDIGAVGAVTNSCSNYQSIPESYTNFEEMIKFAKEHNVCNPDLWEERLRLVGFCFLIKRRVLDEVGLLEEEFTPGNFEDDDYSYRIRRAGYRLILCKDTFIYHFGSASFGKTEDSRKKHIDLLKTNRQKFINKWGFDLYEYSIYDKEIADTIKHIFDSDKTNRRQFLHIHCKSGAVLLDIKQYFSEWDLYGIEENEKIVLGTEHFADISNISIEKLVKTNKNFFDYILISLDYENIFSSDELIIKIKDCLKENGKILIYTSNKEDYKINQIKNIFNYKTQGFILKNYQLIVIEINKKNVLLDMKIEILDTKNIKRKTIINLNNPKIGNKDQLVFKLRRIEQNIDKNNQLKHIIHNLTYDFISNEEIHNCIDTSIIYKDRVYNELGINLYKKKRFRDSLYHFTQGYIYNPDNIEIIHNIVILLIEVGDYKTALEILNNVEEKNETIDNLYALVKERKNEQ